MLDCNPLKHHGIAVVSAAICYGLEQMTVVSTEPLAVIHAGITAQIGAQSGRSG